MPHQGKRILGVLTALCALTTACGTADDSTNAQDTTPTSTTSTTPPPTVPAKAYTVEELATAVGCTPEFQGKLKDFRQG